MQNRLWVGMASLALFALVAVACAAYALALHQLDVYGVTAALAALAIGQLGMILLAVPRMTGIEERTADLGRSLRELAERSTATDGRIAALDRQVAELQPAAPLLDEVRSLRDSLAALARDLAKPAPAPSPPPPPPPPPPQPQAHTQPEREPVKPATVLPRESLDLLLEPVVELNSGATLHYRAQLSMVGGGAPVDHAALMDKAEAGGMRPALELHLLKQALPVLRRLRLKHPNMRAFLPLGAATLNAEAEFGMMLAALEIETDVAPGVVFELEQADLGHLTPAGIDGLAELGRAGAVMAMSHVAIGGLDLTSLRQLGVRYLGIDAGGFDAGFGASPAWKQFSQFARAMQFQLIAGNVATAQQASAATRVARFGYGPFFAPPRRVKADAGQTAASWAERAA